MKHQIKIISTDLMDKFEGTVQFEIHGNVYKGFFYSEEFKIGQLIEVELDHLEYPLDWDVIFNNNKDKELKLEQANDFEWSYFGFGKINSIEPVIADFGDIQLNLGDWTKDPKVIGEYIYWKIERLDISTNKTKMCNEKDELISKKEGYEAMLYCLKAYWENSGSNDLTDVLSGGGYWKGTNEPADSAFWEYWTEAIEKVKTDGPMYKELLEETKKTKPNPLINALLIGVMIGIIIFSALKSSLGFFTLIPLYFIYKLFNDSKKNKVLD